MFAGAEVLIFCIMFTDCPKLLFEIFRLCCKPVFLFAEQHIIGSHVLTVKSTTLPGSLLRVANVDSIGFEFCLRNTLPTRNGARFGLAFGNAEW